MKLYQGGLSPFAARVRMQVYAKGLESTIELVSPPGGQSSTEYKTLNPTGKIPALDIGSRVLPESEVICEYLEDRFPEPSLRPASADGRAQVRLLSRAVDIYLYPRMAPLFSQLNPATRDAAAVTAGLAQVDEVLGFLERFFVDGGYQGGAYAVGDTLTLADCALVTGLFFLASLAPALGRPDAFAATPNVAGYYRQVTKLPVPARIVGELAAELVKWQGA